MYYLYVDESGDTGLGPSSPTHYFVLTGLVIHETKWATLLSKLVVFRRSLKADYGLKLKDEIHAMYLVQKSHPLPGLPKHEKLYILRRCIDWLAAQSEVQLITVAIDKRNKPVGFNVFETAWQALIQRFENTIGRKNFPGGFIDSLGRPYVERGMLLPDNTDRKRLTGLLRKMRHYNVIPSMYAQQGGQYRNMRLQYVIEDPFYKDSINSFIHQMVDVAVYFARQHFEPNKNVKKYRARAFYERLLPIINPHTSTANRLHIKVL